MGYMITQRAMSMVPQPMDDGKRADDGRGFGGGRMAMTGASIIMGESKRQCKHHRGRMLFAPTICMKYRFRRGNMRFYRYMKHFSPFFELSFSVAVFRYALSLPCKRKKIFSFSGNIYTLK